MDAVKLEGGREAEAAVRAIVRAGIPVMGHIGLQPQSVHRLGGFRVQGRTAEAALALVDDARLLEQAGCFAVVLESVPARVAEAITARVRIPTIGIGAGAGTDGQVLVLHDLVGPHGGTAAVRRAPRRGRRRDRARGRGVPARGRVARLSRPRARLLDARGGVGGFQAALSPARPRAGAPVSEPWRVLVLGTGAMATAFGAALGAARRGPRHARRDVARRPSPHSRRGARSSTTRRASGARRSPRCRSRTPGRRTSCSCWPRATRPRPSLRVAARAAGTRGVVVTLQNGLGHRAVLERRGRPGRRGRRRHDQRSDAARPRRGARVRRAARRSARSRRRARP